MQVKTLIVGLSLLVATSALAQQQTPGEQALGAKLMQELQSGLNCGTSLISVQRELETAKARIKELEAKELAK